MPNSLPSTTATLARGLLRKRPGLHDRSVPRIEAAASGVAIPAAWLARYRTLSGGPNTKFLPVLSPQIFAGPLHAQVLSDPRMPVGVLGLVHVSNRVEQHRAIPVSATFDIAVWVEGHRLARQGAELDVRTQVSIDGEAVWSATTTALARGKWGDKSLPRAADDESALDEPPESWPIPANIGRQWRRVSGDPNPIHLHAWLAKPFGFKRAIAHGTWLLARAAGKMGESEGGAVLQARFRRPVFLPAATEFRAGPGGRFELRDPNRDRRHLEGQLTQIR